MLLKRSWKACLTAAVLSGMSLSASAADKVLSDKMLPSETFLYLSTPHIDDMKAKTMESSLGQLWNDPALDDFKEEVTNAFGSDLEDALAEVQDKLGMTLPELLSIPSGELTLAVSQAPGNKLGAVMFLDFGDRREDIEKLLAMASGALDQMPDLSRDDRDLSGTEVVMYNVEAPVAKKTPLAKEFGWFIKDGRLVVSNCEALMQSILDNWSGEASECFANNEVYSYIRTKCAASGGTGDSVSFVDPIGLFTSIVQTGSAGEAGMGAGMALGFLPTLGFNQLKGIGSVATTGAEGFEAVSRSYIYSDQPPFAAMQIFTMDEIEPSPPSWIKGDTTIYLAMNWKVDSAFEAVEQLVEMFQGPGALSAAIDQLSERPPGIHIKNDLVDQMTGVVRLVGGASDSAAPGGDQILVCIGVRDESAVADLLARITDEPGYPGDIREFQGSTVYEIDNGAQSVGFTVAHGHLMIGVGSGLLEQTLRNDDDVRPLADTEDFQKVAAHIPDGAVAVTFSRPATQYEPLYNSIRSGEAAQNFPGMDDIFSKIDFSRLPEFSAIEKYLVPAGGYWVGDDNGVLMQQFSLSGGE